MLLEWFDKLSKRSIERCNPNAVVGETFAPIPDAKGLEVTEYTFTKGNDLVVTFEKWEAEKGIGKTSLCFTEWLVAHGYIEENVELEHNVPDVEFDVDATIDFEFDDGTKVLLKVDSPFNFKTLYTAWAFEFANVSRVNDYTKGMVDARDAKQTFMDYLVDKGYAQRVQRVEVSMGIIYRLEPTIDTDDDYFDDEWNH